MPSYTNLNNALYRKVKETIDDLKKDRIVGFRLRQEQIPQYYVKKHDINAVYKVDLPGYWRLIYGILVIHGERKALLMELFDHGKYDKRFCY
ncbi:MAG: hypothetical protein HZA84_04230 [Thaumarchaeota archaeon]|nr:hypothetical protein [Nitrososphaerota archaeon]